MHSTFPHHSKATQEDRIAHLLHDEPMKKSLQSSYVPPPPLRYERANSLLPQLPSPATNGLGRHTSMLPGCSAHFCARKHSPLYL